MAVHRIEMAILSDDPYTEAAQVVVQLLYALGLSASEDVSAAVVDAEDGTSILLAIIFPGAADEIDDLEEMHEPESAPDGV